MVEPRAACPGLISADLMADAKLGKALTLKLKSWSARAGSPLDLHAETLAVLIP